MMAEMALKEVILRYVDDAKRIVTALRSAFGCRNLVAAQKSDEIPRSGNIQDPSLGGLTFQFHGRGCFVSTGRMRIDVELCFDSDAIGFDAWRLSRYASETLGITDADPDEIHDALDRLRDQNELCFSNDSPYFGLYYLAAPTENGVGCSSE